MNEPEKTKNHTCPTALLSLDEAIAHAEECADNTPCGRNHRQLADWLKELRELRQGNSAAMREAVGDLLYMAERYVQKTPATESIIFDAKTKKEIRTINYYDVIAKAKAAISAPARNCDRFMSIEQARTAYCSECGRIITMWDGYVAGLFEKWLFSPAAERKGEAGGSK